MENVEVMGEKPKKVKKVKKAKIENSSALNGKQKFMEHMNKRREAARMPMAYSEEDIANAK